MRTKIITIKGSFTLLAIVALLMSLLSISALASGPINGNEPGDAPKIDDRLDPLTSEQRELRGKAKEAQLNRKVPKKEKSLEVAKGQYVELTREGEDPIWTVLGEFADLAHNNILEPDRSIDNTTLWVPDFNRNHYLDMLFAEGPGANSMRNFYIEQSSNRYAVYGDVSDWVTVPDVACNYDDNLGGAAVWQFLIDSTAGWYDAQIKAGKSPDEIDEYLSQFDVWDRYDWDGDGNFEEPDGYIDHFQSVHSGEGEEAGGGDLGPCAIWSHSWFAYFNLIGVAGPSPDFLIGGIQIGNSSLLDQ